jgi:capsular polysaccharide biosynthesis protein
MWRYRWWSAAIVIAVLVLSVGAGLLVQPRAQAKATIALATPPSSSVFAAGIQGDASLGRYTAQRAAFVRSDSVVEAVAAELGRTDITQLREDISATPSATSNTITILAEADTDVEAVDLAAAVVAAYRSETDKDVNRLTDAAVQSIEESAARVQESGTASGSPAATESVATTLSELAIQASDIRTSSALFGDGVEFVVAPRTDAVTRPSIPLREAALGLVIGLVLAATAAWIRADTDKEQPANVVTRRSSRPRSRTRNVPAPDPVARSVGERIG